MLKKTTTEIQVGIFATLGIILLLVTLFVVEGQNFLTKKYSYKAHFSTIDGLAIGAKVSLNGVPIGSVHKIQLDEQFHNVEVQFIIDAKAANWIKVDSSIEMLTQGVLGDKYLNILPGTLQSKTLANGAEIPAGLGNDLSQFLSKGDQLLVNLNHIASSLSSILKNFSSEQKDKVFFKGVSEASQNLNQISKKLDKELDQIKIKATFEQMEQILKKINDGTGSLGALINDPSLYDQIKALLGGANRNRIIRNLIRQTIQGDPQPSP